METTVPETSGMSVSGDPVSCCGAATVGVSDPVASSSEVDEASTSISITAITVPTATTSSCLNKIFFTTPATGEGISESTLSVAISSRTSSSSIRSPSFTNQFVMVASSILSPILGIIISKLAMLKYFGCGVVFINSMV